MSDTKQPAPAIMSVREFTDSLWFPGLESMSLRDYRAAIFAAVEAYTAAIWEQALEDACHALCSRCRAGERFGKLYERVTSGPTALLMGHTEGYDHPKRKCEAVKVRALKAPR